jgi:predicted SprT family Zn-dependent metalloprotease
MQIYEAELLALNLMQEHNLLISGWQFKFNKSITNFGVCNYNKKLIVLSETITQFASYEQIKDTILHEIAHALAGFEYKHDETWRRTAIQIGCNGNRCWNINDVLNTPEKKEEYNRIILIKRKNYRYRLICLICGITLHKKVIPASNSSCFKCGGNKYNPVFKMKLLDTKRNEIQNEK